MLGLGFLFAILIALFDQHNGYTVADRITPPTIATAKEPLLEGNLGLASRTYENIEELFANQR